MEENEDKTGQKAKEIATNSAKKVADTGVKVAKKGLKTTLKLAAKLVKKLVLLLFTKIGIIILIAALLILVLIAAFTYFLKGDDSDNVTGVGKYSINTVLKISDVSELVTINGSPQSGYSLAFVDDIDEQLEEVIESDEQYKALGINDVDILKQYIKAELVTQLPDLGDGLDSSKLPNLDGVDILSEPIEVDENYQVASMEGFLMLGDSITVGVQNTGMLAECNFRCEVGVGATHWLEEFDSLPSEATGVCIMLGVNETDASQMKKLIDQICDKYADRPVYVQKVLPLGVNYTAGYATQEAIDTYNNEIQQYCEEKENVYWIDTSDGYVDETGHLKNSSDGLHPNDYKTLVSNIKNKIISGRGVSSSSSGELQGSNPKEAIWGYLLGKGFSDEAAAGIMGNWQQESGFASNNLQNGSNENGGITDEEFTEQVNNGSISKSEFIASSRFGLNDADEYGYGIAQWTSTGRKEGLYDFAEEQNVGIDDLKMQLDYFMKELEEEYSSLLEDDFMKISGGAEGAVEAAIIFHEIYEGSNDSADAVRNTRGGYATAIYEELQGTVPSGTYSGSSKKKSMAVTDREVSEENEFQGAVKLKRVIPNKDIGELSEVDGNVVELTYVPQGVFNAYINQQDQNVLEVYTINNNREIVFAKWTYQNGELRFSQASSINIATVMEKYSMPYDYLMILNVYGEDVEFCVELAQLAIDSEYIIAIQDKVITTHTQISQVQTVYDEETDSTYTLDLGTVEEVLEQDSQLIELTYADSWSITVSKDVTYLDDEVAIRDDVPSTSSGPTSTTEGDITTTRSSQSVTNKYSSGETTVDDANGGEKFVELFESSTNFKNVEPEWLFEALNSNATTTKLLDMTKYLFYEATGENYGVKEPREVYSEYLDNEFEEVDKEVKGTIGWDFMRAWENNTLRKYMRDDGTYTYDSSTYIYSCVTEDRSKYILHDDIGQNKGNKNYGIGVKIYDNDAGYKWQNVDLFKEQGINIRESEYNIYGESQIDVEIIDNISMEIWENYRERVQRIIETRDVEMESYQIDALTDILFAKGNVYQVVDAFKEFGLDEEKMKEACPEQFANERGNARWILFSEGRYCTPIEGEELDPSDYAGYAGDFYELAYELHEYLRENNYWYPSSANLAAGGFVADGGSQAHKFPEIGEAPSSRYVDCSAYVSWVIKEYTGEDIPCWNSGGLIKNPMNFEVIATSFSEYTMDDLQPGDVLVAHDSNHQHTEIYAGDGKTLNCGSTPGIRSEFSNFAPNVFTHVFRPAGSSNISGGRLTGTLTSDLEEDSEGDSEGDSFGSSTSSSGSSSSGHSSSSSSGSSSSTSSGGSSGTNGDKQEVKKNVSTFLELIQSYADQIEKDYKAGRYWEYSNGPRNNPGHKKTYNSFEKAKKGERTTNCARIAFWAYHDMGITTEEDIYAKQGSGEIKISDANRKRIQKYATIKRVNKTPNQLKKERNLKPGDICMYPGHVNVYIGNNKWYDAGRGSGGSENRSTFTRNGNTIYRFKTIGPCNSSYTNTKATYIIRLKDDS